MSECAWCGDRVPLGREWIELSHHHQHMTFESRFCGSDCAMSYLDDGLKS